MKMQESKKAHSFLTFTSALFSVLFCLRALRTSPYRRSSLWIVRTCVRLLGVETARNHYARLVNIRDRKIVQHKKNARTLQSTPSLQCSHGAETPPGC